MLRISDLRVSYGKIEVLHGSVSLSVELGETVAILGANGAGKSTTLRTVSGLLKPTAGIIEFEGVRIDSMRPDEIVNLGISHCPEGRRLWSDMSVNENLVVGAFIRKDNFEMREDLDKMYQLFPKLKERRKQKAGTLSGGEQQMVAIGRALMSRPKLLMFDEPSLGLSPLIVEQVAEMIRQIKIDGVTVLLVEQNVNLGLEMADRAYVLETGKITLSGLSSELRDSPFVQKAYLGR